MSLFKKATSEGLEQSQDRLGGGERSLLETGLYNGKVIQAYAGSSSGGAQNVTLILELEGGKEYRETVYWTNKQGENFYTNKKSGKKEPLPGFTLLDDLALVTTGYPLSEQEPEERIVKQWDFDKGEEVNKGAPVILEFLGKEVIVAIVKKRSNKGVKQDDGTYAPGPEAREENFIEKVFHAETGKTVPELREKAPEAAFKDAWATKHTGVVRDTFKELGKAPAGRPAPVGGKPAGEGKAKNLFA